MRNLLTNTTRYLKSHLTRLDDSFLSMFHVKHMKKYFPGNIIVIEITKIVDNVSRETLNF